MLYIVPWKRSDLGDLVGKPVNSLLDEVLTPVDRDVFKRQNRYYDALKPDEREILAAYRRYGGTINGTVARLDLVARGLLTAVLTRYGHYVDRGWKNNLIVPLADDGHTVDRLVAMTVLYDEPVQTRPVQPAAVPPNP